MPLTRVELSGYDALKAKLAELHGQQRVFVYFTGNKLPETGKSWCPDCVSAEPRVNAALASRAASLDATFIWCNVGGRDYWKDKTNAFRTDASLGGLRCVPTLIEIAEPVRKLEDPNLTDANLASILA